MRTESERAQTANSTAKKLRASKRGQELARGGTRGLSRKIIACFAGRKVKYYAQIFLVDAEEFIRRYIYRLWGSRDSTSRVYRQVNVGSGLLFA